ncbi:hypothetical protein MRX96_021171 [Rhipicephalus microplus]
MQARAVGKSISPQLANRVCPSPFSPPAFLEGACPPPVSHCSPVAQVPAGRRRGGRAQAAFEKRAAATGCHWHRSAAWQVVVSESAQRAAGGRRHVHLPAAGRRPPLSRWQARSSRPADAWSPPSVSPLARVGLRMAQLRRRRAPALERAVRAQLSAEAVTARVL